MRRVTCCQCKCCDYMLNMVLCWVYMFVNLTLKELVLHSPHKRRKSEGSVHWQRKREKSRPDSRNSECWDGPLLLSKGEFS